MTRSLIVEWLPQGIGHDERDDQYRLGGDGRSQDRPDCIKDWAEAPHQHRGRADEDQRWNGSDCEVPGWPINVR